MLPVLTLFWFFHFFTDSLLFAILPICPVFTVFPALESVVTRISDHFTQYRPSCRLCYTQR